MNKLVSAVFLACLASLALASDDAKQIQKDLQIRYSRIATAFVINDMKSLFEDTAEDFTAKTPDGKTTNREQAMAEFSEMRKIMSHPTCSRKVISVELKSDCAIATVEGKFTGDFLGQDGKQHKMVMSAKAKDRWEKIEDRWWLKHSDLMSAKATLDGMPLKR